MDPVSAAASIIAVVQATVAVGKGVGYLRSLRDIPDDFLDLTNELTTLQIVLNQVHNVLQELAGDEKQDQGIPTPVLSAGLQSSQDDLRKVAEDLDALCDRVKFSTNKGADGTSSGIRKVCKMRWQREKRNIARIKERTRRASSCLMLSFAALNSTQNARQASMMVEIRQLVEVSSQRASQEREERTHLSSQDPTRTKTHHQVIEERYEKALDLEQIVHVNTYSPQHGSCEAPADKLVLIASDDSNSLVSLQVSTRPPCAQSCTCQCHQHGHIQSPKWLRSVFGTLFLRYNTIPLLSARQCDIQACRSTVSSMQLSYCFPKWLISRAIYVTTSWDSLAGSGASLCYQVPRVLCKSGPFTALEFDDISWIKRAIMSKELFPNDVNGFGRTLLHRALLHGHIKMATFLFEHGFNATLKDQYGWSAVDLCREWVLFEYGNELHSHALVKRLATPREGDEVRASTPIHDSVLGMGTLPLATALFLSCHDIEKVNYFGLTPLHLAICLHKTAAVKTLLEHGANPSVNTRRGIAPLHLCVVSATSDSSIEIARLLLETGADPNQEVAGGNTAILEALHHPEMIRLLLDKGANATPKTDHGLRNPLNIAAEWYLETPRDRPIGESWRQSLHILISAGIDLDLPSGSHNASPLLTATRRRNNALLDVLVELGARLDAVDGQGNNILHVAAMHGNLEQLETLRNARIKGVPHNATNADGNTPLGLISGRMLDTEDTLNIVPACRRPTFSEFLAFKEMIEEIRSRNMNDERPQARWNGGLQATIHGAGACSDYWDDDESVSFATDELCGSISYQSSRAMSERGSLTDLTAQDTWGGDTLLDDSESDGADEFFDAKSEHVLVDSSRWNLKFIDAGR